MSALQRHDGLAAATTRNPISSTITTVQRLTGSQSFLRQNGYRSDMGVLQHSKLTNRMGGQRVYSEAHFVVSVSFPCKLRTWRGPKCENIETFITEKENEPTCLKMMHEQIYVRRQARNYTYIKATTQSIHPSLHQATNQ